MTNVAGMESNTKTSKFVVGCMQETVVKRCGKKLRETIRFRRRNVKEACLLFIGENKDQAHEKQSARLKYC